MKQRTWLFHQTLPAQIFDITPEEQEQLESEGWVDTPAKLVQTDAAEPVKQDNGPVSLTPEAEAMLGVFVSDPTKLTKDQLIELGKAFGIERLTRNMSEATLISKVQDYLNGNSQ